MAAVRPSVTRRLLYYTCAPGMCFCTVQASNEACYKNSNSVSSVPLPLPPVLR